MTRIARVLAEMVFGTPDVRRGKRLLKVIR